MLSVRILGNILYVFVMLGIRDGSWAIRLLPDGSFSLFIGLKFLFRRFNRAYMVCHVFFILLMLL